LIHELCVICTSHQLLQVTTGNRQRTLGQGNAERAIRKLRAAKEKRNRGRPHSERRSSARRWRQSQVESRPVPGWEPPCCRIFERAACTCAVALDRDARWWSVTRTDRPTATTIALSRTSSQSTMYEPIDL